MEGNEGNICWKTSIINLCCFLFACDWISMLQEYPCNNSLYHAVDIDESAGKCYCVWNRGTFLKIKGILWHLSDNVQEIYCFYFCGVSIDCQRKVKGIAYVLVTPWSALHQLSCQDSKWAQFNQANGLKCWLIVLRSERVSGIAKSSRDGWWCLVVQKTPYQAMDVQFCGELIVRGVRGMSPT